ncbi:MAG: hypothetical protein Q8N45_00285 [Anaerolineales bacterium]|nr:hypothetical protein [Anaerolineales bacterium]MDP2974626.1 hypothetical protein [Anaerolineales bacterium]MDP3185867.1 hypothetical protein [Anaerolineales bacterium]
MDIDLELYRREVRVSSQPLVRLSVIDISPDRPQRARDGCGRPSRAGKRRGRPGDFGSRDIPAGVDPPAWTSRCRTPSRL